MMISNLCLRGVKMSMPTIIEGSAEKNWVQEEFKNLGINCGRTLKRFIQTMTTLSKKPNESIAGASDNKAEAKAIYRLIDNDKLTEEVILNTHRKATIDKMIESDANIILSVQDTTTLNYTSHSKTEGLGHFGSGEYSKGLIVHSALAMTTEGIAFGLLDQKIWTRDPAERGKRKDKKTKSIEEKESYKWLESMGKSHLGIPKAIRLVHVCDREADVYEFFNKAVEDDQDFLVRVVQNRKTTEACKLFDTINNQKSSGEMIVEIPRDSRRNIPKRETTLEIKYKQVSVFAPQNTPKNFKGKGTVTLSILLVKEINPPEGLEPIEWYLATSMGIYNVKEAIEKVSWYVHRWKIERFHYILKSGCEVEKSQNRNAERLQKLILMYSIISIRILSMTYSARQSPESPCTAFMEEEWKILYCIVNKTRKVPSTIPTIQEAVGYLAKLGGFLGRKGDGEPGAKVIWKGLNELNIVLEHHKYLSP
jgi:hypothetical protein